MTSSSLIVSFDNPPEQQQLAQITGITDVNALSEQQFKLHYQPETDPTQQLLAEAVAKQWQLTSLMPEQHSLEDVFMNIIQQEQT